MSLYQWIQNSWVGGVSPDKILGRPDQFQYAEKIDIRTNPHAISLARSSVKDSSSTVVDLVKVFVEYGEYCYAFGNAGNIYRKKINSVSASWSKRLTLTSGSAIIGAGVYNGYLYFCTQTELFRKSKSQAEGTWTQPTTLLGTTGYPAAWSSVTDSQIPNQRPFIEAFNKLYIGDGRHIFEIEEVSGAYLGTASKLKIPMDEEVIGITFNGSVIKFYSRKFSANKDLGGFSKSYMWDGTSASYNNAVFWPGIHIQSVHNHLGNDYILGTPLTRSDYLANASLYLANGYEYRCVVAELPRMSPNAFIMASYKNVLALGCYRGCITYGASTPSYPPSLNFEYPISYDTNDYTGQTFVVGAVHQQGNNLFQSYSYTDGKAVTIFGIDVVNDSNQVWRTGYLVSRIFADNRMTVRKHLHYIDLAFSELSSGDDILVYLRKDLTRYDPFNRFDYTETFSFGTVVGRATDEMVSNLISARISDITGINGFAEFNMLEMKLVLTTTGSIPPSLLEAKLVYEPIYD